MGPLEIPRAHFGQVAGLLESVKHFEGRTDLAKIAADLKLELDDILPVVDAAELLGLAKVDSGDISLTEDGSAFVDKGIRGRKLILRERLSGLSAFQRILSRLNEGEEEGVPKEAFIKILRTIAPDQDPEAMFTHVVEWGRHALLLKYDSRRHLVKPWPRPGKAQTSKVLE